MAPPVFKFKCDITKMPLFFQICSSLVSKIEICPKYFLDKNSQKQPLWYATKLARFFQMLSRNFEDFDLKIVHKIGGKVNHFIKLEFQKKRFNVMLAINPIFYFFLPFCHFLKILISNDIYKNRTGILYAT